MSADVFQDGLDDVDSALDAIGDACTVISCAGEMQTGMTLEEAIDLGDTLAMTYVVLRRGLVPAIGAGEDGLGVDAHGDVQFVLGELNEGGLVLLGEMLGEGTADEDADENAVAGSAVGKLLRGPGAGGDATVFAEGDDKAQTIERVVDVCALECERDRGGRDVTDVAEVCGERGVGGLEEAGGDIGRGGEDDMVKVAGVLIVEGDFVLLALGSDGADTVVEEEAGWFELREECVDQLLQAATQSHEHGAWLGWLGWWCGGGFAGELLADHAADEAAVLLLHLGEHGEGTVEAEGFGVGGVDAGHEGCGDFIEQLGAEAATDEAGEALVLTWSGARDEELETHADFSWPGDERGTQEGHDHGGSHEHHAFGHGVEFAVAPDIGGMFGWVGTDELIVEPQGVAEFDGRFFLREKGVGSAFDDEALLVCGGYFSAEAGGAFDEGDVEMGCVLLQVEGDGKSCDAAADDCYLLGRLVHSVPDSSCVWQSGICTV